MMTTADRLFYMERGYDHLMDQFLLLDEALRDSPAGRMMEYHLRQFHGALQVARNPVLTPILNLGPTAVLTGGGGA